MSALTADRPSLPENKSYPQASDFISLQRNLDHITASITSNVAVGHILSIGGNPKSAPSLSFYQTPEENLSPDLTARLNELSLLKKGWDEGEAVKIKFEAIKTAREVLRRLSCLTPFQNPCIVPTFDGFLQLEWHNAYRSLEFEYTPEMWSILGVESARTRQPIYNTASVPLTAAPGLEPYYVWFANNAFIWPST
jgi:hypothetical protein